MIAWHYVPTDHERSHDLDPGCWCEPKVSTGTADGVAAVLVDHRSDTVGPFDVYVTGPGTPETPR